MEKDKKVFISYSHNDSNYVDRLKIYLKPIKKIQYYYLGRQSNKKRS